MDIVILGPTSSGKTLLAEYVANQTRLPIFNCDSVQIYENLNICTNKPCFIRQSICSEEKLSITKFSKEEYIKKIKHYNLFSFQVILHQEGELKENKILDTINDLTSYLETAINNDIKLSTEYTTNNEYLTIKNYLFDILKIPQTYSVAKFIEDIDRIKTKFNFASNIICGGTIYYAYHYILGTKFNNNSSTYFKPQERKKNFLLILLTPKDRHEYYKYLDVVIAKRISLDAMLEIQDLTHNLQNKKNIDFLSRISYEYRFFIKLYELYSKKQKKSISTTDLNTFSGNEKYATKPNKYIEHLKDDVLFSKLLFAEHQYAKRQLTFMKKLVRELNPP